MPIKPDANYDALFTAILNLETLEECYAFFEDLCTIGEVTDMRDRLQVARYLIEGLTYEQIEQKIKMSSATISRINRCIQYGPGGYRTAVERLEK